MGVAVAVAGQHRVGVACAPSYMRERGEARRMGVAVAVAWQHQEGVACVPSYMREARPDEWASQSLWPGSAGLALHVSRATR